MILAILLIALGIIALWYINKNSKNKIMRRDSEIYEFSRRSNMGFDINKIE
jgi:hypothetical protein